MTPLPPFDTRQSQPDAAHEEPARAQPTEFTVDLAPCCPYCGHPVAVVNLLMPVEEPPGSEQPPGEHD